MLLTFTTHILVFLVGLAWGLALGLVMGLGVGKPSDP